MISSLTYDRMKVKIGLEISLANESILIGTKLKQIYDVPDIGTKAGKTESEPVAQFV